MARDGTTGGFKVATYCEIGANSVPNPGACAPVAVWIVDPRAARVLGWVVKQASRFGHNAVGVGPGKTRGAGFDSLGALGLFAHYQHRLAQGRRFLLDAAGIREQQVSSTHKINKRHVIERLDQGNAWVRLVI